METDSTYGARAESILVKVYRSVSAAYDWLFIIGAIMLFGYVMPFAGLNVPLTIWLTQRDIDPVIDE